MAKNDLYFKPREEYYIPLGGNEGQHNKVWIVEKLVFKNNEVFINLREKGAYRGIQVKQEKVVECYVKHLIDQEMNVNNFLNKVYQHPIVDKVARGEYGWTSCHIYKSNTGCKAVIDNKLLSVLIKDKNIQSNQELHKFLQGYFTSNYFNN